MSLSTLRFVSQHVLSATAHCQHLPLFLPTVTLALRHSKRVLHLPPSPKHPSQTSKTPSSGDNSIQLQPTQTTSEVISLHCPRAGPGRVEAIFAGPDPGPQGWATLSLALAPGRLDPRPGGSGQGRVRADPGPLIFSSELIFFFKCSNFNIFVDFYVLLNSSVNSYLFMMK